MKLNRPPGKSKTEIRGSAKTNAEPRFLVIGRVIRPHGIRGDLRVESHTDDLERFSWIEKVYLNEDDGEPLLVENVRFHQKRVLLKLKGVEDRNAAESLRHSWLYIPMDEVVPLEEDEYFLFQLIGLKVVNQNGDVLGEVSDVLETKANNVFIVKDNEHEHLIPDIPDVIREINFTKNIIKIYELPGLIIH
ncbi:MAG: ribosome maturation factor RimM [Anaerolineae bacterium]|nr:MAG: ribosome maturation factor RimM [Anaerolineae bacterium]